MRWSAGSAVALVLLLAGASAAPAGESFLDRNLKVHEAIPYPPTREAAAAETPTPSTSTPPRG